MIQKIKSLFQHNFVKDTAVLQAGNIFSTGLSFLSSIIFARFLGPENYGTYGLIFGFVGLMGAFMNWGAAYATLTLLSEAWARKDKEEVRHVIIFFLKISLIMTVTAGLLALIFSPFLAGRLYHNPLIGQLARLVILANLLDLFFALLLIVLQTIRKIKSLTLVENLNKIIYVFLTIGLVVLVKLGLRGIMWGYLLTAVVFFVFSVFFYRRLRWNYNLLPSWKEIVGDFSRVSVKKYFKFGFLIAVDNNISNLFNTIPLTFLGMTAFSTDVGYFKIAFSYIGLALIFLKPISRLLQVQLPQSKIYGHETLKTHFFKTTFYSAGLMTLIIIPMLILGKFLVTTFYGSAYLPSVKLIYLLSPYPIIAALGVGLSSLFRTLNKMKAIIIIDLIVLVIGAPFSYYLIRNWGLVGMSITTIIWTFLPIVICLIYFYKYFNYSFRKEQEK